jgi:phosphatidylinositol-3,4,5-trisphosphate 3-phosphatase/dual-specificity protein phosphatase PTEN
MSNTNGNSSNQEKPMNVIPNIQQRNFSRKAIDKPLRYFRKKVSLKKKRFREHGYDLDLTYITPNIIASGFPSSGKEVLYRNPKNEMLHFLENRHKDHYFLWNLCSDRYYDPLPFHGRVTQEFSFKDHQAPVPFSLMEKCCISIDKWLKQDFNNVALIHCKAGKGRTGVIISCYLIYSQYKKKCKGSYGFLCSSKNL